MGKVSNLKKRFPYLASCIGVPGILALLLVSPPATFPQSPKAPVDQSKTITARLPNTSVQTRAKEVFSKMPLSFELNQGQTNEAVRFFSRGNRLRYEWQRFSDTGNQPGDHQQLSRY
jgi:hypothetical protein